MYLTELLPILGAYDVSDSYNSDIIFEDGSSDDVLQNKTEKPAFYEISSLDPFPIYKYNQNYHGSLSSSKAYSSIKEEEVHYFIPFYILSQSLTVANQASYSVQKLFLVNKYSRIYILDQISFIIKEFRFESSENSKRVGCLYTHLDILLGFWVEAASSSDDERDYLQSIGHYQGDKTFSRDLEVILRLIETLTVCNLMLDSPSLKKTSVGILRSTYDLLRLVNPHSEISVYECVINKVIPIKKFL